MLDKSIPYVDIVMHRNPGVPIPAYPLPPGYRFLLFRPGDEAEWARIEASVLEFDDAVEALLYFQRERLPYAAELVRRCLFIEDGEGRKVATASAWWNYTGERRDPWLHWVAVRPEYQGLGLGKAVVGEALRLMTRIEGERDFYLHTQTWSHRAVGIYEKAGFAVTDRQGLGGYENSSSARARKLLAGLRQKGNGI